MRIAKTLLVAFFAFYQLVSAAVVYGGLRYVSSDGPCNPGELVFVGFCNLCLCNSQGIPNQLCAKSWCPVRTPLPRRSSITII